MTRFGYPSTPAAAVAPPGPALASGTYVPFIGIASGIASGTTVPHAAHWMQVGDIVQVAGWIEGQPLQMGLLCQFTVDLPVVPSPAFTAKDRLTGVVAVIDAVAKLFGSCAMVARTAGNAQQAEFYYDPLSVNVTNFEYTFSYSIV